MCQDSEYGKAVNMRGLHRALNMAEYTLMPQYGLICLNNADYDCVCLNIPE